MAGSEQKSVHDRLAVLEERYAKLEQLLELQTHVQEQRRAVIPDAVWNSPEFIAYRDRNARINYQCMLQNVTDASEQIESARMQAAEKRAVEDQRTGLEEQESRRAKATFELATEQHLRDGVTPEEAGLLAAVEVYENFRSLPPGYQVEYKPNGVDFTIRTRHVS